MYITRIKRILSVVFISILLLYQPLIYAQEIPSDEPNEINEQSYTPTPTIDPQALTLTPTPTPDPSEDYYEASQTVEDENSSSYSYPGTDTDSEIYNSGDDSDITSSSSATVDLTIENDNDLVNTKDITTENNTGGNEAERNIDLTGTIIIDTGDADISEHISTVANTNVTGESILPLIMNYFETSNSDFNYSDLQPCYANVPLVSSDIDFTANTGNNIRILFYDEDTKTVGILNNNKVEVINNVILKATTGDNSAVENIGATKIDTGNATINLDMFNMLNTNLSGTCGFFGVMNFFAPQTQNLILPYEIGFLYPDYDSSLAILNTGDGATISKTALERYGLSVDNNNYVDAATYLNTETNTGDNVLSDTISFLSPPTINTGDAFARRNILDIANINLTGDGFMYIRINHFGNWKGQLLGSYEPIFQGLDFSIYRISLEDEDTILNTGDNSDINLTEKKTTITNVDNNNNAYLRNNISLMAGTGNNEAGRFNSEINTGNAEITADIFNLINTNIHGNNWYFGIINMFDTFEGDIIFPRPDVSVSITADKSEAQIHDTLTYTISYANEGYLPAKNVSIIALLPEQAEYVSSTPNGQKTQNTMSWLMGTMSPGVAGTLQIMVNILDSNETSITATTVATTSSYEPNKDNNSSAVTTSIIEKNEKPAEIASAVSESATDTNNEDGDNTASATTSITPQPTKAAQRSGAVLAESKDIDVESNQQKIVKTDEKTSTINRGYFDWERTYTLREVLLISFLSFVAGVVSTLAFKRIFR